MNWELLEKCNFDKKIIAEEMKVKDEKEIQALIDECILNEIKKITKFKPFEECLKGLDFSKVKKASNLTNKRIESQPEFYFKLLNASNEEKINELCDNSFYSFTPSLAFDFVSLYVGFIGKPENFGMLSYNLEKKYEVYLEHREAMKKDLLEEKNNLQQLAKARKVVLDFIDSNFKSVKSYLIDYNSKGKKYVNYEEVNIEDFQKYVDLVKEYDEYVSLMYEVRINQISEKSYPIINLIIDDIVNKIKNGVLENGKVRNFDPLDYFSETRFDCRFVLRNLKERNIDGFWKCKKFFERYGYNQKIDKISNNILNERMIVNVELDRNNKPIPGTGIEITKEIKYGVIDYLEKNNIPLYDIVYYAALKRYINNMLNIDSDKNYIKNV